MIDRTGLTANIKPPPMHQKTESVRTALIIVATIIVSVIILGLLMSAGGFPTTPKPVEVVEEPDNNSYSFVNNHTYPSAQIIRLDTGWLIRWNESCMEYTPDNTRRGDWRTDTEFTDVYYVGIGILIITEPYGGVLPAPIIIKEPVGKEILVFDWEGRSPIVVGGMRSTSDEVVVIGSMILDDDWWAGTWSPDYGIILESGNASINITEATLTLMVLEPVFAIPEFNGIIGTIVVCAVVVLFLRKKRKR